MWKKKKIEVNLINVSDFLNEEFFLLETIETLIVMFQ